MADEQLAKKYSDLVGMLGGMDGAKAPALDKDGLTELVKEFAEAKRLEAKVKVKEVLGRVWELKKKMTAAEREFNNNQRKFTKEMNKLLSAAQAALAGQPPPKDPDQQQQKDDDDGDAGGGAAPVAAG